MRRKGIFLDLKVSAEAPHLAFGGGPRRLSLPLDRADRLVGLAPAVRHFLFPVPYVLQKDDEAPMLEGGRRPCQA